MPISILTNSAHGKIVSNKIHKSSIFEHIIHKCMMKKASESYNHVKDFIKKSDKILDVGLGSGTFSSYLKNKNYKMFSVDVVNMSLYKDIQPTIYNGKKLPYKDDEFDIALLISVLHHCGKNKQNLEVLKETMRVSKRVIIIEDSFRNELERKVVSAMDQFANWEFWKHPYLTNNQWFKFINRNHWHTVFAKQYSQLAFGVFYTHYCMYVLEKHNSKNSN
ncbi:MAG: methyltransferase domain-containing protein [Pseudomonadales bacterium]|nr:methyltransferase domain-containing protein [Pseudomonadales bacterium]